MGNLPFDSAELAVMITDFWFITYFSSLFTQALSIAMYVLESVGIYSIAKRRQIKHPWLAWFPVANLWLLGSISDQYQYVAKGRIRNKRKVMVILGTIVTLLTVFYLGSTISALVELVLRAAEAGSRFDIQQMLPTLTGLGILAVTVLVLSIVQLVFHSIALYDLYSSCIPKHNVIFLILSILISATRPFFIFFNREKDEGMPPRRAEYIPQNPTWQ